MIKYYFYRRTLRPKEIPELKHYFHGAGLAGYTYPQSGDLLYYGTVDGVEDFIENRKVNRDRRE